jgi:hypothetical protein
LRRYDDCTIVVQVSYAKAAAMRVPLPRRVNAQAWRPARQSVIAVDGLARKPFVRISDMC